VIANNTVENNGGTAVSLISASNTTVSGNKLSGNAGGEVVDWDNGGSGAAISGNGTSAAGADMSKVKTASGCSSSSSPKNQ
jgi:parallel beta-helix repeat protein